MVIALRKTWNVLGAVYFTAILFLMLFIDLVAGFLSLRSHPNLFRPLNDIRFFEWANTYGAGNLSDTAWFFVLLILLLLLSINTFVCTTNRVFALCYNRSYFTSRIRFALRFSPHIMHYAFLVILLGYLSSYLLASNYTNNILIPGKNVQIPESDCRVRLESLDIQYYEGDRLLFLKKRAIDLKAVLLFMIDESVIQRKIVSVNRPVWFKGFSVHVKDFAPKTKGSKRQPYINLNIKRDPGMKFYFTGTLIFVVGLFMYMYQWFFVRVKKGATV